VAIRRQAISLNTHLENDRLVLAGLVLVLWVLRRDDFVNSPELWQHESHKCEREVRWKQRKCHAGECEPATHSITALFWIQGFDDAEATWGKGRVIDSDEPRPGSQLWVKQAISTLRSIN
jgi:hypothetical protein